MVVVVVVTWWRRWAASTALKALEGQPGGGAAAALGAQVAGQSLAAAELLLGKRDKAQAALALVSAMSPRNGAACMTGRLPPPWEGGKGLQRGTLGTSPGQIMRRLYLDAAQTAGLAGESCGSKVPGSSVRRA